MFSFFSRKYLYIISIISCITYSQLVLKSQLSKICSNSDTFLGNIVSIIRLSLSNFLILSAYASTFIGMFIWFLALRIFPLSVLYPFLSITYVTIYIGSCVFFKEPITLSQSLGVLCIVVGSYLIQFGASRASHPL